MPRHISKDRSSFKLIISVARSIVVKDYLSATVDDLVPWLYLDPRNFASFNSAHLCDFAPGVPSALTQGMATLYATSAEGMQLRDAVTRLAGPLGAQPILQTLCPRAGIGSDDT